MLPIGSIGWGGCGLNRMLVMNLNSQRRHDSPFGPFGRVEQAPVGGTLGEGELPLNKTRFCKRVCGKCFSNATPIQLHPPQQLLLANSNY